MARTIATAFKKLRAKIAQPIECIGYLRDRIRARGVSRSKGLLHQVFLKTTFVFRKWSFRFENVSPLSLLYRARHQICRVAHRVAAQHQAIINDQSLFHRLPKLSADPHRGHAQRDEQQQERQKSEVKTGAQHEPKWSLP